MNIEPVAHIYTDFPTKFGLPYQSGVVEELTGRIVFEPHYRDPEAVKGLSGFDYIWLLWDFSRAHRKDWSATVCPPRLGGKVHMGVFATRSPFRPNSIGLSSVRLREIRYTDKGPELIVSGIDMMDGTPVYDIKPYLPEADSHPEAAAGFTERIPDQDLKLSDPQQLIGPALFTDPQAEALRKILRQDPRPRFDADDTGVRVYGFYYLDYDVRFTVRSGVVTVREIVPAK